jgi:hypothetical protein
LGSGGAGAVIFATNSVLLIVADCAWSEVATQGIARSAILQVSLTQAKVIVALPLVILTADRSFRRSGYELAATLHDLHGRRPYSNGQLCC